MDPGLDPPRLRGWGRAQRVTLWSADTETLLIAPGLQAPPLVCLQFAYAEDDPAIVHVRDPACYREVRRAIESGAVWNFHNAAYDVCVLMAQYPDLIEPLFDLCDRDGVVCTIVRQKLLDIARGKFKRVVKRGYALDRVAAAHKLDLGLDKNDPWRLRYGELLGLPVSQWPADAIAYAAKDVTAQRLVYHAQEAYARARNVPLVDQYRQTRAALWLRLMECRGLMVDPARCEAYIATVRETLIEDREVCQAAGLVDAAGTKKLAPAMRHMVACCRERGDEDLPLSDGGEDQVREFLGLFADADLPVGASWRWWTSVEGRARGLSGVALHEEAVAEHGDALLESYQRYATSTTQLARAERLYLAARAGVPVQASFGSLQDTGRTSCSQGDRRASADTKKAPTALGAQLQNPAKDRVIKRKDGTTQVRKGPRELYVARPGYALCSTDWNSMELCTFAQVCLWSVGFSRMAEVLNAGKDPHTELAAQLLGISADEAYAIRKGTRGAEARKKFNDVDRDLCKRANFGFLGGMGEPKFIATGKKQGVVIPPAQAAELRAAFRARWTEDRAYGKWCSGQLSGPEGEERATVMQYWSGRVRAGCWYSALRNTLFQGLAADIKKQACWRITREMRTGRRYDTREPSPLAGCWLVNDVHDEPITELRLDVAHEAALRQAEIQIETSKEIAPGLAAAWAVEPCLMTRWIKSADAIWVDGRLTPYDFFAHSKTCTKRDCRTTCTWIGDWRDRAA